MAISSREFMGCFLGGSGSYRSSDAPCLHSSVWTGCLWGCHFTALCGLSAYGAFTFFIAFEMNDWFSFPPPHTSLKWCVWECYITAFPHLSHIYLCLWTSLLNRMGDHIGFNNKSLPSTCLGGQAGLSSLTTAQNATRDLGTKVGLLPEKA